jgi:hypothetical protein
MGVCVMVRPATAMAKPLSSSSFRNSDMTLVVQSTVCYVLSLAAVFAADREFERKPRLRVSDGERVGSQLQKWPLGR